jgi:cytochrome c oxidase subunit 1
MPRIRSERPAFDAKYPHLAAGGQSAAGPPEGGAKPLTSESDAGASYREDIGSDLDRRRGEPGSRRGRMVDEQHRDEDG